MLAANATCSKGCEGTDDSGGGPHVVTPNHVTAPDITIFTPTLNQVFSNGSVINVTGKITDDFRLYRGAIRVVNDANGVVLEQLHLKTKVLIQVPNR